MMVLKCIYKNYLAIFGNTEFDYVFQSSKFILNIFYEVHNVFILFLYIFTSKMKSFYKRKTLRKVIVAFQNKRWQ